MTVNVVSFLFSWCWGPHRWVLAFFTASYQHLLLTLTHQGLKPLRPGVAFPTTSRLSPSPTVCNSTTYCSIRRPYFTFKLQRRDMDTSPRLRNFFRYLAIGMYHFRYLWNCLYDLHRAEIIVLQFTGHSLPMHLSEVGPSPCPISSVNFCPRDFLL